MTKPKRSKTARPKDADYDVGYGKPPKRHQFKPGHSGNPEGRPKGAKNEATILREIMHQRMEVREGGQARKISRLEALLLRCLEAALKGDLKAMAFLLNRYRLIENAETEQGEPLSHDEQSILEEFAKRFPPNVQPVKE
ncbi:hypothetical protein AUC71_01465 [Methyloceanibacter marginalis]|uniref:DUF5681 domain-containing protein n=1 Tax=Methyloceanibacter marginalis TaxID=1774971 RepID=A0A1E3WA41_9HYPH|nr:DUF5681 domain-containing protein [Methyloceanibacter marginalis]ODS02600.1 hypothetical protein AUC71_01465 [Methyloceanibacter marginalis]